jgi:hypothetical protein
MALSSDNVKTIGLLAEKFEKWAENLSYSTSPSENLWTDLTLSLYPQDIEGIASWLANISTEGQKIRNELEELSRQVQEIDAWRNQGVYPEDLGEFCAHTHRLMKVARNIISILRKLSVSGESEPQECKAIAAEESNISETRETATISKEPAYKPVKPLPKEALMAYKLRYENRLNIQQIAKRMTAELKLDKAIRPWQISRWIKQAENLYKRTRIPIRSVSPKASGTAERAAKTDAAAQTNHNKT